MLAVCLVGLVLLAGGCASRAIKETLGVATGAKGMATPLRPVAADSSQRPLGVYERCELGKISDDMNGHSPAELLTYLPDELARQLAAKRIPNAAAGRTLTIQGKILHYEESGLFGQAFGPLEEVVARIELVDKQSGKVLGVANCVGRTKETVNLGVKSKAEGLAKAIAGWIDKRYPEDKRTAQE